jgi:Kef-type K+ transport system membrane component KefB
VSGVDTTSFLVITVVAATAALAVAVLPKRAGPPVVVVELLLGIAVGPHGLELARVDDFIAFFSNLGLALLFFFAGYEIDLGRIRGRPLQLGSWGWLMSVVIAYAIGAVLVSDGIVLSFVFAGTALATTAIGTLIPILRDSGELRTGFGRYLLAAGAVGEFGPILLVTLVLSTQNPLHEAGLLVAFVAVALGVAVLSVRWAHRAWPVMERTLEASSQLAVRIVTVLVFGLTALAADLGLDILVGGFAAGMIMRLALQGHDADVLESKLAAIGFGLLVPFFFVTSGMRFDLDALVSSAGALLKVPLFLALLLVVRGAPALLLYRGVLGARDRLALAFFSATALPLVVGITTIATAEGHMRSSTAAALVGAAIVSTLAFPFAGLALRRPGPVRPPLTEPAEAAEGTVTAPSSG